MTGKTAPGAGSSKLWRRPSHGRQPKFVAAPAALRDEVDLLDLVLSDVADDEVPVGAVEGEAPRVAQPVGVDLAAGARAPDEGVRGRDRVRPAPRGPGIDPQDLAQRRAQRLRVAPGAVLVVAAAAVAGADVHELVGPEDHQARRCGWARGPPCAARGARCPRRRCSRWRGGTPRCLGPTLLRVVDVEQTRLRVVRGEGHREQALLAAGRDLRADVEERLGDGLAAAHDDDPPRLLDDEDPPPVAGRRGDVERAVEVADLDQAHAASGSRAALGRARAARVVVGARRRVGVRGGVLGGRVRATARDERGGSESERDGRAQHPRRMPWPCNAGRTGIDCAP